MSHTHIPIDVTSRFCFSKLLDAIYGIATILLVRPQVLILPKMIFTIADVTGGELYASLLAFGMDTLIVSSDLGIAIRMGVSPCCCLLATLNYDAAQLSFIWLLPHAWIVPSSQEVASPRLGR